MFYSLDVLHVNAYLAHFRLQTDVKDQLEQEGVNSVIGGDNARMSHCHGLPAAQICP